MEQKYWMHRCTCGEWAWPFASELLKKHNMISIGWSDFSNNEKQDRLTAEWESFNKVFTDEKWGLPRNRYNLWRFLNEMHTGDIVVVPLPQTFNVYRIADDVVFNNITIDHNLWVDWNGEKATLDKDGFPAYADGRQIDMGFYRKVNAIAIGIPRDGYAKQALYSRLKIQQTNADISDLKDEVEFAIKCYAENKPINLRKSFLEESSERLLKQMQELLNDTKLEHLVKWYMEQLGADAVIPPKNGTGCSEGDADVIATFNKLNNFTLFIQVKAHQGYTDEWAVEQITTYKKTIEKKGKLTSNQLWVISTCMDFSEKAKQDAESNDVHLVAGLEFAKMLIENGVYSLPY
jgi:predicted Mrr-cat superfamily restriction endonuclease